MLSGLRGIVYAVAFSPDGKLLATGSGDETIKLWNLETHTATETLRGPNSGVSTIAFTPDQTHIVSVALPELEIDSTALSSTAIPVPKAVP